MEQHEVTVREQWLRCLLVTVPIAVLSNILTLSHSSTITFLPNFFLTIVLSLSLGYLDYYFAYKNRGTKWLLFFLITLPLGYIAFAIHNDGILWPDLFAFAANIYWWINCYQLYKVNKAINKTSAKHACCNCNCTANAHLEPDQK